ncbi:hypothetical protein EDC04DRAFT_2603158 [Pisolithus marmoratus]|nr:hypothetical protein EDC04DRAFT_2603158 [Pisolithus marmoratus]
MEAEELVAMLLAGIGGGAVIIGGRASVDERGWVANTQDGGCTYLCGMGIQMWMSEAYLCGSDRHGWVLANHMMAGVYLCDSDRLGWVNHWVLYQGGSEGSVSQPVGNTHDGGHTWVGPNVGVPMGGGGMGQSDGEKVKQMQPEQRRCLADSY